MKNSTEIQSYLTEPRKFNCGDDLQRWTLDFTKEHINIFSKKYVLIFLKSSTNDTEITGGKFFNSYKEWESYFLKLKGDSKHIAILPENEVIKVGFSFFNKGVEFCLKNETGSVRETVSYFKDRLKRTPSVSLDKIFESVSKSVKANI